jgi:hypothetical protein
VKHNQLVDHVMSRGHQLGLIVHHCTNSRFCKGTPGMPDILAAGPRGVLVAEIKTGSGDLSAAQDLWVWMFAQSGAVHCYVWRDATDQSEIDGALAEIA